MTVNIPTVQNLQFVSKNSILIFFFLGRKTRENVVVLDILAVDNFDFTRLSKKKNWIFGQKFDFSNSV